MIQVGVLGAQGRMGQWVTELIAKDFADRAKVGSVADRGAPLEPLLENDVVIDFSSPEAALALANTALARSGKLPVFVIGSTGWKLDERRVLEELGKKTAVLMSSNFSTGVMALTQVLKQAAPLLEKLGYTPIIIERHHRHKKDAPSGTAISLQRAISPAGPGNVQTHSVRAGEIVGDHEITFYGPAEHLVFGHFAEDRSIFARGAIAAAIWLAAKKELRGLIGMESFFQDAIQKQ